MHSLPRTVTWTLLAFAFCLWVSAHAQVAGGPKAESRVMRLDQEGTGVWVQSGLPDERVTHVTLGGNPTQPIGIEFTLGDGTRRALAATLEGKDGESLRLKIVGSGDAKASGRMTIRYGPKNSIRTLSARGSVNRRRFHVRFESGFSMLR